MLALHVPDLVLGAEGATVIKMQLLPSNSQSMVRARLVNVAFQYGEISIMVEEAQVSTGA